MTRRFARRFRSVRFVAVFIATLSILALFATPAAAQNPVPFVNQPLVPDAAAPGGAGFTLTVNGAGFVSGSTVNWNGSPRATTFVSSSQLTAAILASDIATASTVSVTAVSPGPGGGSSNAMFFPINTPATTITFGTTDYTVGLNPTYAAAADFNGDGRLDLAVPNYGSSSVSVMVGNGDGTFQSPVDYPVGSGPQGEVVGDFRGDGKLDLAVTYRLTPSSIDVLLGNGDGTFQPAASYGVGNGATYTLTADFNRDGNLDLLVVNQYDATVSILLGNGDGTFQPQMTYSVGGSTPTGAAAGDFNGDGKLDIAVSNWRSNTVTVLLGNGDGTFQPAVAYPVGTNPGGVNIADLNGDGILDLLVPNQGSSNVSVLLGKGDGTFAAQVEYPVVAGAIRAELGDFNQDGKLDLAVATYKPSLDLLLGNGDGTFQPSVSFPTVAIPWNVVVADFNQDGRLDAAVPGSTDASTIAVMLQIASTTSPTTTALASSLNPSNFGQSVTFTAAVNAASGTPTGTVIFYDGATALGNAALANGSASLSTSLLAAGPHSITAAYQGSAVFAPSTSSPLTQLVYTAGTTTSVVSSAEPAGVNKFVTYTATVTSQYGGVVTGSATFRDGGATIATVAVNGNQAAYRTSYSVGGIHSITATYSGDANNAGSASSTLTEEIGNVPFPTETTLTTSGSPSFVGQPVTLTASVTSIYGAIPNGELVTFRDDGAVIGTGTTAGGVATFSTSSLTAKTHTIKATYAGDSTFKTSSGTVTQVVGKYATTMAVVSSLSPSVYGQAVTWTATVSSNGPNPPTGRVYFVGLGYATLSGGVATLTKAWLNAGTYAITAEYKGNDDSGPSVSSVLSQMVNPASTTTVITSSADPSTLGQNVTFTATVTSSTGAHPTGTVTFKADATVLGTVPLEGIIATFSTSTLPVASFQITAIYNGTTDFTGSSDSLIQSITP